MTKCEVTILHMLVAPDCLSQNTVPVRCLTDTASGTTGWGQFRSPTQALDSAPWRSSSGSAQLTQESFNSICKILRTKDPASHLTVGLLPWNINPPTSHAMFGSQALSLFSKYYEGRSKLIPQHGFSCGNWSVCIWVGTWLLWQCTRSHMFKCTPAKQVPLSMGWGRWGALTVSQVSVREAPAGFLAKIRRPRSKSFSSPVGIKLALSIMSASTRLGTKGEPLKRSVG